MPCSESPGEVGRDLTFFFAFLGRWRSDLPTAVMLSRGWLWGRVSHPSYRVTTYPQCRSLLVSFLAVCPVGFVCCFWQLILCLTTILNVGPVFLGTLDSPPSRASSVVSVHCAHRQWKYWCRTGLCETPVKVSSHLNSKPLITSVQRVHKLLKILSLSVISMIPSLFVSMARETAWRTLLRSKDVTSAASLLSANPIKGGN